MKNLEIPKIPSTRIENGMESSMESSIESSRDSIIESNSGMVLHEPSGESRNSRIELNIESKKSGTSESKSESTSRIELNIESRIEKSGTRQDLNSNKQDAKLEVRDEIVPITTNLDSSNSIPNANNQFYSTTTTLRGAQECATQNDGRAVLDHLSLENHSISTNIPPSCHPPTLFIPTTTKNVTLNSLHSDGHDISLYLKLPRYNSDLDGNVDYSLQELELKHLERLRQVKRHFEGAS